MTLPIIEVANPRPRVSACCGNCKFWERNTPTSVTGKCNGYTSKSFHDETHRGFACRAFEKKIGV